MEIFFQIWKKWKNIKIFQKNVFWKFRKQNCQNWKNQKVDKNFQIWKKYEFCKNWNFFSKFGKKYQFLKIWYKSWNIFYKFGEKTSNFNFCSNQKVGSFLPNLEKNFQLIIESWQF